jgi:hypothetical protein
MQWYYVSGGQAVGPVNEAELQRLAAQGIIVPATLVWHEA